MNKLTIPSILAATVLIAGIFAFMPVEKASTVHSSLGMKIDGVQTTVDNIETTVTEKASALRILEHTDGDQDAGDKYTVDCTTDYVVIGIIANMTGTIGAGNVNTLAVTVGGADIIDNEGPLTAEFGGKGVRTLTTANIVALADEDIVITAGEEVTDDDDEQTAIRVSILATDAGTCTLTETATPAQA